MVKNSDMYAFFLHTKEKLYLLNGGAKNKLVLNKLSDLEYYYDNLPRYVENIRRLFFYYNSSQEEIASFIKRIGGYGRIHGCIIDIDFYNHLYVNPIDGSITPYFAWDIIDKQIYPDIPSLLKTNCSVLYDNYIKFIEGKNRMEVPRVCYPEDKRDSVMIYEGTEIYRPSKLIRALQYVLEKGVVRKWNDKVLHNDFSGINILE